MGASRLVRVRVSWWPFVHCGPRSGVSQSLGKCLVSLFQGLGVSPAHSPTDDRYCVPFSVWLFWGVQWWLVLIFTEFLRDQ